MTTSSSSRDNSRRFNGRLRVEPDHEAGPRAETPTASRTQPPQSPPPPRPASSSLFAARARSASGMQWSSGEPAFRRRRRRRGFEPGMSTRAEDVEDVAERLRAGRRARRGRGPFVVGAVDVEKSASGDGARDPGRLRRRRSSPLIHTLYPGVGEAADLRTASRAWWGGRGRGRGMTYQVAVRVGVDCLCFVRRCPSALRFLMSLKSFCLSPRSRTPNLARSIHPSAPNSGSVRPPRASWYLSPSPLSHSRRARGPRGRCRRRESAGRRGAWRASESRSRSVVVSSLGTRELTISRERGDDPRGVPATPRGGDARGDFRRARWRAKSRASSGRSCVSPRRSSRGASAPGGRPDGVPNRVKGAGRTDKTGQPTNR